MRGRVVGTELDQCAAIKISLGGNPAPALPALPRFLVERNQPLAFDRALASDQVGVGRAGSLDDPNPRQKRLPAALSVKDPSGPISK